MENFEERQGNQGMARFRAIMHLGMGVFYLIIGMLIIYIKAFGAMELPTGFAYVLGSLMLAYGLFRIWRGWVDMKQMKKR
jgi:uncharacterized membrane protein